MGRSERSPQSRDTDWLEGSRERDPSQKVSCESTESQGTRSQRKVHREVHTVTVQSWNLEGSDLGKGQLRCCFGDTGNRVVSGVGVGEVLWVIFPSTQEATRSAQWNAGFQC